MPFREIDAAMHAHTQITTNFLAQASWRLWNRTTSNFLLYNIQYSWWSWWSWWLCWSWWSSWSCWSGQDRTSPVSLTVTFLWWEFDKRQIGRDRTDNKTWLSRLLVTGSFHNSWKVISQLKEFWRYSVERQIQDCWSVGNDDQLVCLFSSFSQNSSD